MESHWPQNAELSTTVGKKRMIEKLKEKADIIITATPSDKAIIKSNWIKEIVLILMLIIEFIVTFFGFITFWLKN